MTTRPSVLPEAVRGQSRAVPAARPAWAATPGAARARPSAHRQEARARRRGVWAAPSASAASPAAARARPLAHPQEVRVQSQAVQAARPAWAASPAAAADRTGASVLRVRGARHDPDGLAAPPVPAGLKCAVIPAAAAPNDRRNAPDRDASDRTGVRDRQAALAAGPGASARVGADRDRRHPCLCQTAGPVPAEWLGRRRGRSSLCLPAQSSLPAARVSIHRYVVSWTFQLSACADHSSQ